MIGSGVIHAEFRWRKLIWLLAAIVEYPRDRIYMRSKNNLFRVIPKNTKEC